MTLSDGIVFGENDKVRKEKKASADQTLPTVAYKKAEVCDNYYEGGLIFKEFSLTFRAYEEGVAYRFTSSLKNDSMVLAAKAQFNLKGLGRVCTLCEAAHVKPLRASTGTLLRTHIPFMRCSSETRSGWLSFRSLFRRKAG